MKTMLTISTYAGLILTTFSAIWGLTHELHTTNENNDRRLTKAGRYSVVFILLGLCISMSAAVLKNVKENRDKRASDLAAAQKKQADELERVANQQREAALAQQTQQKSGEQTQLVRNDLDRSQHPLFPIKIHAVFQADLRHGPYATYRERLVKAAPANEDSSWPELAPGTPLFPDPNRERDAYSLLVAPPQMKVFLFHNPAESSALLDIQDSNLTIVYESTSADPPVAVGQKPSSRPAIEKEYAFSKDGIVSIHFPTETINEPAYSDTQIVSDLDLLGGAMAIEVSPWFTLYSVNIELPGGREMQFGQKNLQRSKANSNGSPYIFRFPRTKEAFSKLFI